MLEPVYVGQMSTPWGDGFSMMRSGSGNDRVASRPYG